MRGDATGPSLQVGLLGTLTLHVDGQPVRVPGQRRRTLLAALAMASGRRLSTERLVDLTWPEDPPDDPVRALYNHISRLRGHLGPAGHRLTTHDGGYALDLDDDDVDVRQARSLADRLVGGTAAEVRLDALEALSLWRGPALQEFRSHADLAAAATFLDELQARLRDDLTAALLEIGDRAVAEAQSAAAEQPLRERTALLLVRALAQDGRPAEAMDAAASYRRRLAEETGLDPGPALAALEEEVAAGRLAPVADRHGRGRMPALVRPEGPLVGRERDHDELRRLLDDHRVVTITGAGGVGKTRLALDVAADVADEQTIDAVVVDLAAVDHPARVAQAVGSTLLLRTSESVTAADIARALGDARLLLVLDNCEHVVEACRDLVDAIAARVPGVRTLATSRIVLHSRDEYVLRLQPLPVPTEGSARVDVDRQPSVRTFLEHARRSDRSFVLGPGDTAPLVEVLRRLDGLPLAIEIAAGQATTMPIATLRDRLAPDLDSRAARSDDTRQATLRTTIRWSYDMLTHSDRALLLAVAPFPGGIDLDTLEHLADEVTPGQDPLRLLRRLVDASLLDVEPDRSRYRLLFTVRTFLLDQLRTTGDIEAAEARFVRRARAIATEIGADLFGPAEAAADRRLRAELANLRAARDLARDIGEVDELVDITLALDQPSIWRDLRELWAWCLELADDPLVASHGRETEILGAAAEAARLTGAYDHSHDLARRGLASKDASTRQRARCESALAGVALYRGDFTEAARGWLVAAKAEPGGCRAAYVASAALASTYGGEPATARELLDRATTLADETECVGNRAFARYVSGEVTAHQDQRAALPYYESAITEATSVGASFVAGVASVALASAQTMVGDRATAARAFAELLQTWHATGQTPQLWTTARNAAALLLAEGRVREAVLLTIHAERSPEAATVDERIAAHSSRAHVPLADLLEAKQLALLRQEAETMSVGDVLGSARLALLALGDETAAQPSKGS